LLHKVVLNCHISTICPFISCHVTSRTI